MADLNRISQVSKKLNKLTLRPDFDLRNRLETCDLRYKNLETKFNDYQECQFKRYNNLKEQLLKLQKTAQKENEEGEKEIATRLKKMNETLELYTEKTEHESYLRKEGFKALNRRIDGKSTEFKQKLNGFEKNREENMNCLYEYIEVGLVE